MAGSCAEGHPQASDDVNLFPVFQKFRLCTRVQYAGMECYAVSSLLDCVDNRPPIIFAPVRIISIASLKLRFNSLIHSLYSV